MLISAMINLFLNKLLQVAPEGADTDTKHHIYVQSKWGDQCTELLLHDSRTNKCFKGQLNKTEIQEAAEDLEVPYDTFSAECRSALTANITLPGFECEIDEAEMVFRLTKKQEFDVQYLEIKLKELKSNCDMLDTAIQLIESGQKAEEVKVHTAHKSDQDHQVLLDSYQQCVEEKKLWKQQMLRKFALLLNSKKDKIAKQQEELRRYRNGGAGVLLQWESDDMDDHHAKEDQSKTASKSKRGAKKSDEKAAQCRTGKSRAKPLEISRNEEVEEGDDDEDFNAETQRLTPPKRSKCDNISDNEDEEDGGYGYGDSNNESGA